ncbi:PaaI family thioesterase [Croceibacter atlanticus]|uniref:PaaI family thioesterase n=1 Tax=Croceibacter atlanticus TaxID=313588 RepID=UPI0032B2E17F
MNADSEHLITKAISGPFAKHLSISVVEARTGHAVLEMPASEIHKESNGSISYGAIVALADTAIGIGARTLMGKGEESATLELQIVYLQATCATRLFSQSDIQRESEALITGTVTVRDDQGNEIAIGQGTFAVFRADKSPSYTKSSTSD